MFFRFSFAVILVVLTSLLGIAVEKQNLEFRREISRQHYRMDVLKEQHSRLRVRSQDLSAIQRLVENVEKKDSLLKQPEKAPAKLPPDREPQSRAPFLFWNRPLLDPRLNDRG